MAAPRRNMLTGTSDWQREEKANQQRDYAAQLQEQIRLKNAAAEQEKARKLHEQQMERETVDRDRAANTKQKQQPPPQQQQHQQQLIPDHNMMQQQPQHYQHQYQQQYSPGKSPTRASSFPQTEPEMHHSTAILSSPSKPNWSGNQPYGQYQSFGAPPYPLNNNSSNGLVAEQQQHNFSNGAGANSYVMGGPSHGSPPKFLVPSVAPVTYSYSFTNTPSVFATLLHESEQNSGARAGSKFHESIEALQRLGSEIDHAWKERRVAAQSRYAKPSFVLQPEPKGAAPPVPPVYRSQVSPVRGHGSPLRTQFMHAFVDFEQQQQEEDEEELELGIPRGNQSPETGGLSGESVLIPLSKANPVASSSPSRRSTSPAKPSLRSPALRHHSELLHFPTME